MTSSAMQGVDLSDDDSLFDSALVCFNAIFSDDDEEHENLRLKATFIYTLLTSGEKVFWTCLIWQNHVQLLLLEEKFERTYMMSLEAFDLLVEQLGDSIRTDE